MYRKNRRVLNASGRSPCEVCNEEHFLVQHHIEGRKVNRANNPNNLANICSNCHLKVHRAEIIIEKKVMSTSGYILLWHYKHDQSISGEDSKPFTY